MSEFAKINSLVRPFITIVFTLTFCYLALTGDIGSETFVGTAAAIITWWFKSRDEQRKT